MKRALPFLLLPFLAACSGNAISTDAHNTFLDDGDLVRMTDKMAASLTSDAQVASQAAPLIIVIKPIVNQTNQIIRGHEKELYVARLQDLLASKPGLRGRFQFVLNREDYNTLIQAEGKTPAELGPDPVRTVPNYALTGTFSALTNDNGQMRSDYYLCTYKLDRITGPDSGVQVWADHYETKKIAHKDMLD